MQNFIRVKKIYSGSKYSLNAGGNNILCYFDGFNLVDWYKRWGIYKLGRKFCVVTASICIGTCGKYICSKFLQTQHRVKLFGYISIGTLFFDLSLSLLLVAGLSQGFQGRLIASSIAFSLFGLYGVWLIKRFAILFNNYSETHHRDCQIWPTPCSACFGRRKFSCCRSLFSRLYVRA